MKHHTLTRLAVAVTCALLAAAPPLAATEPDAVARGVAQFEAGDLVAARQTLEGALDGGGERHRALAYLGRISLAQDELDAAIDRLKEAVALFESSSPYRTWLGQAYIQKLQTVSFFEKGVLAGRALEALQKAVKLDPANVEARVTLAGYYLNAPAIAGGSRRKAREQAEAVLEIDAARGNLLMARAHLAGEEWDAAAASLRRCIDAEPTELDCRFHLAMLHQQLERYADAFEIFEQLLEIEPEARGALYQLGRTAVFSGANLERGVECLRRYLALAARPGYPGHDAAHWRLGMLFERLGDAERARAEYEAAIALAPDEDNYRASLKKLGEG